MAQPRPNALFIGQQENINDYLAGKFPEFDFLNYCPTPTVFFEGLTDGSISNDIQIIFIMDSFFDAKGDDPSFEQLIATYSPYVFFGILNYNESLTEAMRERIDKEVYALGGDAQGSPYYFIDTKKPKSSIVNSLNHYIENSQNPEVVARITGEEYTPPASETPAEEERDEYVYTDSIVDEEPSPYLGKVVAVTSSKGGSGKSTIAVATAAYLSHASISSVQEGREERPLKVLIFDLDVRDGQLGFLTGQSAPTIIKLLNGLTTESIENTVIYDKRLKCDLLLAPKRPRNSDEIPPEFYVELIQKLRKMYDFIILDTSVNYLDPLLERVAYPTADQIIFVTDIVVNSVFSMARWITEVTKPKEQQGMGINRNKIAIVVNKALEGVNMGGDRIAKSTLGIKVLSAVPSSPKLIAHAANLQSMDAILRRKEIEMAIKRIAVGVVNGQYDLSNNLNL